MFTIDTARLKSNAKTTASIAGSVSLAILKVAAAGAAVAAEAENLEKSLEATVARIESGSEQLALCADSVARERIVRDLKQDIASVEHYRDTMFGRITFEERARLGSICSEAERTIRWS